MVWRRSHGQPSGRAGGRRWRPCHAGWPGCRAPARAQPVARRQLGVGQPIQRPRLAVRQRPQRVALRIEGAAARAACGACRPGRTAESASVAHPARRARSAAGLGRTACRPGDRRWPPGRRRRDRCRPRPGARRAGERPPRCYPATPALEVLNSESTQTPASARISSSQRLKPLVATWSRWCWGTYRWSAESSACRCRCRSPSPPGPRPRRAPSGRRSPHPGGIVLVVDDPAQLPALLGAADILARPPPRRRTSRDPPAPGRPVDRPAPARWCDAR